MPCAPGPEAPRGKKKEGGAGPEGREGARDGGLFRLWGLAPGKLQHAARNLTRMMRMIFMTS